MTSKEDSSAKLSVKVSDMQSYKYPDVYCHDRSRVSKMNLIKRYVVLSVHGWKG